MFHRSIQYAMEKLGKSKSGFERTVVSKFKRKRCVDSGNELVDYSRAPYLGADQKARGLWEQDCYSSFSTPEPFSFAHDGQREGLWGTLGPSSFVICSWLKQRKRFWLVKLWRGKIWTCLAKVVPPSWEFCLFFMQITDRARNRKMCSFRRFLSLKKASKV